MLCLTPKCDEQLIQRPSLSLPLVEIPSAVTVGIFCGLTVEPGVLNVEEHHEIVILVCCFAFDPQLHSHQRGSSSLQRLHIIHDA